MFNLSISPFEYQRFCVCLKAASGIALGDGQEYLVLGRLRPLMEREGLLSFSDLLTSMEAREALLMAVIEAMATGETEWFRDEDPYRILRERILPDLVARRQTVHLWSAACSTGQEPYSMAIELLEYQRQFPGVLPPASSGQVSILATDLSDRAVRSAARGVYPQLTLRRGLSSALLQRYFQTCADQGSRDAVKDRWEVSRAVRELVTFQQHNLKDSLQRHGPFDVIFCRNVLIYFSPEWQWDVIRHLHRSLKPSGYLVVGSSENVVSMLSRHMEPLFDTVSCFPGVVYRAR